MRPLSLFIICLTSAALTGCAPAKPVEPVQVYYVPVPEQRQDILSLGRELSNGTVDIYEPGVNVLSVSAVEHFTPRPMPVAKNKNFIVRDPSVTAYSIDAMDAPTREGDYPSPFNADGTLR